MPKKDPKTLTEVIRRCNNNELMIGEWDLNLDDAIPYLRLMLVQSSNGPIFLYECLLEEMPNDDIAAIVSHRDRFIRDLGIDIIAWKDRQKRTIGIRRR